MADISIIGGGVAGLSAGIYSLLAGNRVTIYEKHVLTGGNLTGWNRAGCAIDNCIHWLTGTNPVTGLYKMWTDLGALGNVPILRQETLFTVTDGCHRISLHRNIEDTVQEMLAVSPTDEKEIRAFGKAVTGAMKLMGIFGKLEEGRISGLQKLASVPALLRYYSLSTDQLAERFKSPLLREFFHSIMPGYFGAAAFIMTCATFCGGNGDIPEGGSRPMAKRMTQRFLSLGGKLRTGMEACRINLKNGLADSVLFRNGETEKADYFIVTADPDTVFGKMLDVPMPKKLAREYRTPGMHRFSSCHCAFSCAGEKMPFSGDLIVEIPPEYRKTAGADTMMLREFSGRKDAAPEGKTLLQAMIYCSEDRCREYLALSEEPDQYQARKRELANAVAAGIERKLPEIRGDLRCIDCWTPATYRRYTGSAVGSFMAFSMPPHMIPRHLSNRVEGVGNLVLASQWLLLPGGLPPAAVSGKKAAETVTALARKEKI